MDRATVIRWMKRSKRQRVRSSDGQREKRDKVMDGNWYVKSEGERD